MAQAALAEETLQLAQVTTGLKLAAHGAWFDRQYRCIPARSDHGALTVLVHISLWEELVSRRNGDVGEATHEVCRRAMASGQWRSHNGAPALVLPHF